MALTIAWGSAVAADPVDRVLVHKAERRLELLRDGQVVAAMPVALGGDPLGHKQAEGDGRTPEGVYRLDWRNPASAYHRSMHVSYPDDDDVARARAGGRDPGGMIMIHGQRNNFGWLAPVTQLFDWTDGCIAVTNADMDIIWSRVPDGTVIEIRP
ncbi:L,D-transpeptidase family protein [Ensifer soli]|uniref:L,D-transpeptidase family protein n=1 Tax=Ciceribacter sp. sgz301302 TaxID=3342379 RepID=UPI0035B9DA22